MEAVLPTERFKRFSNILLRVPAVFLLEMLYHADLVHILGDDASKAQVVLIDIGYLARILQVLGYISALLVQVLSFEQLLKLYRYIITGLLMVLAHYMSTKYIEGEVQEGYSGFILSDPDSCQRWVIFVAVQITITILCTHLMEKTNYVMFMAYLLPLMSRLISAIPLTELRTVQTFAMAFTTFQLMFFMIQHMCVPYNMAMAGYQTLQEYMEVYGFISVVLAMYSRFFVPAVYLIFWLVLFCVRIHSYFSAKTHPILNENYAIILLAAIADCCDSPWSLIGLCYTVSYVAFAAMTLCKVYLQGFEGLFNHNMLHRGWTEGITLLLLALQTGVLEMKRIQRIFLLGIVLFVVFASTLQSMHEITEPVLMALTAAHNRSAVYHLRVLAMCVFLFFFPLYMTYIVCTFFETEFWLLIIVSSCVLTSIQVLALTITYALFMIDGYRKEPWENLDDLVYYIKAFCRVLEFLVAISVLFYGGMESMYSDYSVIGVSVIIVHCYFNVWQRAQMGWKSFLLRRDAMRKVTSLPEATQQEIDDLNDVCAICYQDLKTGRVTPCHHIFHGLCLRKWLYVQDKCPLCHRAIITVQTEGGDEHAAENANRENDHIMEDIARNVDNLHDNADQ